MTGAIVDRDSKAETQQSEADGKRNLMFLPMRIRYMQQETLRGTWSLLSLSISANYDKY